MAAASSRSSTMCSGASYRQKRLQNGTWAGRTTCARLFYLQKTLSTAYHAESQVSPMHEKSHPAVLSSLFTEGNHATMITIGLIANPASGKDIRRLVAHGSVFDNEEK